MTANAPPDEDYRAPECPSCGSADYRSRTWVGTTPAGSLWHCVETPDGDRCGHEWLVPDAAAAEATAERARQLAEHRAEATIERTVGPVATGPVRRLGHPAQVQAMAAAAVHAIGTAEGVVTWLRGAGYELVAAEPVRCSCPFDSDTGHRLRNPRCTLHGDADGADDIDGVAG